MFSHAYDWVKKVQTYWLRNSGEELISIYLERVLNFPERVLERAGSAFRTCAETRAEWLSRVLIRVKVVQNAC